MLSSQTTVRGDPILMYITYRTCFLALKSGNGMKMRRSNLNQLKFSVFCSTMTHVYICSNLLLIPASKAQGVFQQKQTTLHREQQLASISSSTPYSPFFCNSRANGPPVVECVSQHSLMLPIILLVLFSLALTVAPKTNILLIGLPSVPPSFSRPSI